jgi:hypothetical protein
MLNKIDKVGIVNGAELQVAKELVIENNPAYKEIFDNIASKLDCNLRYREFMDYYNGNLISNDFSNEMKTIIAKAYNIAYNEDLTSNDLSFRLDNTKHGFSEVVVEKYREHEIVQRGILKYHHEKSSFHSSRTINAKKILEVIDSIKSNYVKLNILSDLDKAKIGGELLKVSPLEYAVRKNNIQAIKELLIDNVDSKTAKVDSKIIDEIIKEAIIKEDIKLVDNIQKNYPQTKDKLIGNGGKTYLSYAVAKNKPRIAAYMIDMGFKPQESFLESLSSITNDYGGFVPESRKIAEKIGGKILDEYKQLEVLKEVKKTVGKKLNYTDSKQIPLNTMSNKKSQEKFR